MTHKLSIPPFDLANTQFDYWCVEDGVNETGKPALRLEYRSSDGRCSCGPNVGHKSYWAKFGSRLIGTHYRTLVLAMAAAAAAMARTERAAA